jgi:cbb3-type cytochrome oxidase subunit 3
MTLDVFLLILKILFIVLLYLFLMQVVIAIYRDLKKTSAAGAAYAGQASPKGQLVVVDSGPSHIMPGTSYLLTSPATIGRNPASTIQILENFISNNHSRMWFSNGTWYIQDAGSTNGTYLIKADEVRGGENELPAREALPVRFGDKVKIGYIFFQLKP